jgi:hypothetical protein
MQTRRSAWILFIAMILVPDWLAARTLAAPQSKAIV